MIKFSSEAVTDKVLKGLGFSGENEEVISSPFLNCDVATLTRERAKQIKKSYRGNLISLRTSATIREECKHLISFLQSTARAFIQVGISGIWASGAS